MMKKWNLFSQTQSNLNRFRFSMVRGENLQSDWSSKHLRRWLKSWVAVWRSLIPNPEVMIHPSAGMQLCALHSNATRLQIPSSNCLRWTFRGRMSKGTQSTKASDQRAREPSPRRSIFHKLLRIRRKPSTRSNRKQEDWAKTSANGWVRNPPKAANSKDSCEGSLVSKTSKRHPRRWRMKMNKGRITKHRALISGAALGSKRVRGISWC